MGIFSEQRLAWLNAEHVPDLARQTVMIVDDEDANLAVMAAILEPHYSLLKARNGIEALELIEKHPDPDQISCIVSDHRMPHLTGVELLERLQPWIPKASRIVVTGFVDVHSIVDSINKAQIYKFIVKPFDADDFLLTIRRAVEVYELQRQMAAYQSELERRVYLRTQELEEGRLRLMEANRRLEREIAVRQKAESELRAQSNEILALYNNASCGYHAVDNDGWFIQMNDTELAWLGRTKEEVIGKIRLPDIMTSESLEAFYARFPEVRERGWLCNFRDVEFEFRRKDGTIVPVLLNATVAELTNDGGKISRSTVFDITQRRRAQERQAASEKLLRAVTDHLPALVAYIDLERRYQFNNRRYETWLHRELSEITGHSVRELHGEEVYLQYGHYLEDALRGNDVEFEFQIERNGDIEYYKAIYVPQFNTDGTVHGVCVLINDITAFKSVSESFRRQKLEAESANASKSRFLAAASHDLRQPLHALGLLTANLRTSPDDASRNKTLDQIEQVLEGMDMEFHALLDVSKLDAGVIQPEFSDFPISQLLNNIAREYSAQAAEKGLGFKVISSKLIIRSDPILLGQILRNLVSNAIKHTDRGRVIVGCRRIGTDTCSLNVIDTGRGIPLDQRENIFQEFVQLHNPERDRTKGMGLGLAIVRRISHLLNTEVELASDMTHGSLFRMSVPISNENPAPTLTAQAAEIDLARFAGRFVAVLDDDEAIVDNTAVLLRSWGCRVLSAQSYAELDTGLRETPQAPDLLLFDYRTREKENGVMLASRLIARFHEHPPAVLIMTGDTSPGQLAELRASGHRVLTKPVRPAKLRAVMANLFES